MASMKKAGVALFFLFFTLTVSFPYYQRHRRSQVKWMFVAGAQYSEASYVCSDGQIVTMWVREDGVVGQGHTSGPKFQTVEQAKKRVEREIGKRCGE